MPPRAITAISLVPPPMSMTRVPDGPLLDAGHAARHADHHVRLDERAAGLADEVAEHRLGDHVVGDDAVLHRPDRVDVARGPPDHLARLLADGHDALRLRDGHHRGLLDDDPLAEDVDEHVGRAQVDPDLHTGWGMASTFAAGDRSIRAPSSR